MNKMMLKEGFLSLYKREGIALFILILLVLFLVGIAVRDISILFQHLRGFVDIDFFRYRWALCCLILWALQVPCFLHRTNKLSTSKVLLLIFAGIVASYVLAVVVYTYVRAFNNPCGFQHIPTLRDIVIEANWIGDDVWRMDFPWGFWVFPLLILLFYTIFVIIFARHFEVPHICLFVATTLISMAIALFLLSITLEISTIAQEGIGREALPDVCSLNHYLIEKFHIPPLTP